MQSSAAQHREPGEPFGPRFVLFADMLAIGLATTAACLPVVTAPAAFAAACAVLRGAIREQRPATLGRYVAELRAHGLRRTLAAGAVTLAGGALPAVDLLLARAGLPGAGPVAVVVAAVAAGALVVGLRGAAEPRAAESWREAVRTAAGRSVADPSGSALLLAATVLCAVLVWMLPLLAPLTPGILAFAVTAVSLRTPPDAVERAAAPSTAPAGIGAEPAGQPAARP
ncbi:DUF624 domain-containing protein [Streptomyces sp. TS71-3]|uniref:DUF624 domain-containing protein n=1 Tax=Streptomyces sp. TS71-3 TaxID=2733862 RepID=UPI001BB3F5BF|nr:DUF624 domain-containing protein [Streptomyces sp. TS71-3]